MSRKDHSWGNKEKIDICTPPEVLNQIVQRYGIDHDPCPLYGLHNGPNGLDRSIPWGKNNFLNPPYNKTMLQFIDRAVEEKEKGNNSYFLVPFRPYTSYYQAFFNHCTGMDVLTSKIKFQGYDTFFPWPLIIFKIEHDKHPIFNKVQGKIFNYVTL
jgi:hypothetical protein